ncbi:alpha/beta hydrolase [Marinococcus halotolerans]|uniref:alpha/beta hydrolase n=1 Tax=Marinococcus halotolerans TaxID=301092 RepID=UPI00047F1904|nr:alpha/beta fold hydrolase [Marinococcus halotolerans]
MMRVVPPKSFTFEGGNRAVLLLHGFTGSSADVRMMGRFLEKKGYTVHAPVYKGHGVPPEELMETDYHDWWEDVKAGIEELKERGFDQIAVGGLSLGGLMALRVAYHYDVLGVIPMSAPMSTFNNADKLYGDVINYAKEFKRLEGKDQDQIDKEIMEFRQLPTDTLHSVNRLIREVSEGLDMVHVPAMIVQGEKDDMIAEDSANIIYEEISSEDKQIKWYPDSPHVITLGNDRDELNEDVYQFLDGLNWSK